MAEAGNPETPEDVPVHDSQSADTSNTTILRETVTISGKTVSISLTDEAILLVNEAEQKQKAQDKSILWCDVLKAENPSEKKNKEPSFVLHYIEEQKNKRLSHKSLSIICTDTNLSKLVDLITEKCSTVPGRPKRLFIVINPVGGNHRAPGIYKKSVAPLLELAGVKTTVITTERRKHALEIGETQDFSEYDGIVTVGGDGMYQEILQGYFIQLQKTSEVDINNREAEMAYPTIPFCLIPAGSSNGWARFTNHRIREPDNSTLRILRGKTIKTSFMTVYEPSKFVGLATLGFGCGFMNDMMKRSDELRWMGKLRYPYSFLAHMFKKKRQTNLELKYCVMPTNDNQGGDGATAKSGWMSHDSHGKLYNSIMMMCFQPVNVGDHSVVSPSAERALLSVMTEFTIANFLKLAIIFEKQKKVEYNENMLDDVSELEVKFIRDENENPEALSRADAANHELEHYFYFDGEVIRLENLHLFVKVHPRVINMFGEMPEFV